MQKRTLLLIFLPAALLITPILTPINYIYKKNAENRVSRLNTLTQSNVSLDYINYYQAYLVLSFLFIVYICQLIQYKIAVYIEIQQNLLYAFLSIVLINLIFNSQITRNSLKHQLQVFLSRIYTIFFNQNFSLLSKQVKRRIIFICLLKVAKIQLI